MSNQIHTAFRENAFRIAVDTIEWSTAPLVWFKDGQPRDHRSAVLIQAGDFRFIVTAGHFMRDWTNDGQIPAILMPEKGLKPVPLISETWHTTKSDQEDLSVARLTTKTINSLANSYRYIRVSDMRGKDRHQPGLFLVMGFPYHMVNVDDSGVERSDTWKILTFPIEEKSEIIDYDPDLHLALQYDKVMHNREGNRISPEGMSGCGIWAIKKAPPEIVVPGDFELVAIQNRACVKREYIKGTWVDIALAIIWKYHPEARNVLGFHGFHG